MPLISFDIVIDRPSMPFPKNYGFVWICMDLLYSVYPKYPKTYCTCNRKPHENCTRTSIHLTTPAVLASIFLRGDHCRLVQSSRLKTPSLKENPRPVRGGKVMACSCCKQCFIWGFPKMGVPLVIIHFNGIFYCKLSILGYHYFRKPPYHGCHDDISDKGYSQADHIMYVFY